VRITKNEEFGLRLVTSIARSGGQLNIRELAEQEGLPEATIAKVVARLRRAGLLAAERGRNGGYSLTRGADSITLADVVGAFGNEIYDAGFCGRMNAGESCAHDASCGLRPVWNGLGEVIGNFLDGYTVGDIVRSTRPAPTKLTNGHSLPVVKGCSG
jgi:Rrf2 family protein